MGCACRNERVIELVACFIGVDIDMFCDCSVECKMERVHHRQLHCVCRVEDTRLRSEAVISTPYEL